MYSTRLLFALLLIESETPDLTHADVDESTACLLVTLLFIVWRRALAAALHDATEGVRVSVVLYLSMLFQRHVSTWTSTRTKHLRRPQKEDYMLAFCCLGRNTSQHLDATLRCVM